MKKLCLLANPHSGKGLLQRELYPIVESFHREGWLVTVIPVAVQPDTVALLGDALAEFDRVVCCGGDGTLNHTVDTLLRLRGPVPELAYLPMGSTNDFARTLGYSDALDENCRIAVAGRSAMLDVGLFGPDRHFCYVAAFGAFTDVSYSTPRELKNSLGQLAYLLEGLRSLPQMGETARTARVTTDTGSFEGSFIYGAITNSTSVGGLPAPNSENVLLDDGMFEVLLCALPASLNELNDTIAALARGETDTPCLRMLHTRRLELEFDRPTRFTLDGEFGGEVDRAVMEVQPRAVRMLLPENAPLQQLRGEADAPGEAERGGE